MTRRKRIMKKERKKHNINGEEKILEQESCKTVNCEKFINYIRVRNKVTHEVQAFYTEPKWRKINLRCHINSKKSINKFINRVKEKYPGNLLLIYGDWGTTPGTSQQHQGFTSTLNIGLRRAIHRKIPTVSIDEYHTSKLCWHCHSECQKVKSNKGKEIYSLLRCPADEHKGSAVITRDLNATRNMRNLLDLRLQGQQRPKEFKPLWTHRRR